MNNEAGEKIDELAIFDQIDEALEERAGTDRRKRDLGPVKEGEERRKQDRRASAHEDA